MEAQLPEYRPGQASEADLMKLFQALGTKDAGEWASSEASEGIAQLARYIILRAFWDGVVRSDELWIENMLSLSRDNSPTIFDDAGPALKRLLAAGAARSDLTSLVRAMQALMIDHVCNVLDDPGLVRSSLPPDVANAIKSYGWALFEVDRDDRIGRPIDGLHESVLQVEPGADRTG